ncbi:MAG: NfeD family protein [Alphaproteobacteria bacterium]|nr:NfeD family protein [Alphaproteobacteria bacterium]
MDSLNNVEPHYAWLAIGLILAAAEMAIPGVFLLWMSGAALIVGTLAWFTSISVPWQIVIFAVLAIVAVFSGRRYVRNNPIHEADPMMNKRADRLVGETVVVTQAIDGGTGKVKLGDSEWLARGADAAVGARLKVMGHEGTALLVEPAA